MKNIFIIIFFLSFFSNVFAQDKILYLDVSRLLNDSDVGKYLNTELSKINKSNIDEFKKIENSIKSEEENIIKQKNILKTEEYNSKINDLKNKFNSYQELKNRKNMEINQKRNNAANKILKIINEILSKYSSEKEISLIIEKKNIVIGKTQLDITDDILKLLNKKMTKIEIK